MGYSWISQFVKDKDPKTKKYYEKQFKSYRNLVSSLLRKAKDSYYKQYFEDNKKNLRLVWRTIKGVINIKKGLTNLFPAS